MTSALIKLDTARKGRTALQAIAPGKIHRHISS
jgi:hypothetical protein